MAIPSETRESLANRRKALVIPSPSEEDARILRTEQAAHEAVRAGLKAAAVACVASAVPTLVAVRTIPWFKANINHTGQALIVTAASVAAFAFKADKTTVECARRNAPYNSR